VFYLDFLTRALEPGDEVTRSFIETMLPQLLARYTELSAKGGDHRRTADIQATTRQKWEEKCDQSMVSHLTNGIFPVMRLINWLEEMHLGPTPISDVECRLYILAYLMHDVDKMKGMRDIDTMTREAIEESKALIAGELQACNAEVFFPDLSLYLEDITYLVVNTHQKYGTHLHTYLWQLHLRERRLQILRRLCIYSDHIAYLVSSPAAILHGAETQTLSTILAELSDDELVFTYHQVREVRGLLTSVMNNALVQLFKDGREDEIRPYLFFSDGVVYIQRKRCQFTISTEQIVEKVQGHLRELCAGPIRKQAPGFKFSIQGMAKHPAYYFEFLSLEEYGELLARFTMRCTKNDVTATPLAKIRQMQRAGEIPASLPLDDLVTDVRAGMLSRFLSVIFVTVLDLLGKEQQALRARVEQAVIEDLELTPYWEQALAIPNKGGMEYRWFWLGACYLRDHPGIREYEGQGNLQAVFRSTLQLVFGLAGAELSVHMQQAQKYLGNLAEYLNSVIELPLAVRPRGHLPNFQGEMDRYIRAKEKGKRSALICTLCNSSYPTEEQADSTVLFQPWVYKNKLVLYAGKSAGGVCAICSLELMLRQITLKGQLRLTGSKFEALKTKYLAIYPNFFFTAETGALVQGIVHQLQDVNFFTVRKELNRQDISIDTLLHLDVFAAPLHIELAQQPFIYDEEHEEHMLDSADETERGENDDIPIDNNGSQMERSYIKFKPDAYPGMCFFGMRAGKETDDTSTWAMPAFLALALPLVTQTRVVVSEMPLPLFSSGREFRETVVFDAPHPFLSRLLQTERVRINDVLGKLKLLSSIYTVNLDTYAHKGKPEWKHLSAIVRDLETDPLFLFSYLRKQERGDALYPGSAEYYMHVYRDILEEDMGKISACVDAYTAFYHGGYQSHSILKPVDIAARAIITSPLDIDEEDLHWQIQGEITSWLDRVRSRQAKGWAVFYGKDIETKQMEAIRKFIDVFYREVFLDYCQGERGLLRNRVNRFKDGCEAYYIHKRNNGGFAEHEEGTESTAALS
jgi:CRISPR-associated protein Csc3